MGRVQLLINKSGAPRRSGAPLSGDSRTGTTLRGVQTVRPRPGFSARAFFCAAWTASRSFLSFVSRLIAFAIKLVSADRGGACCVSAERWVSLILTYFVAAIPVPTTSNTSAAPKNPRDTPKSKTLRRKSARILTKRRILVSSTVSRVSSAGVSKYCCRR